MTRFVQFLGQAIAYSLFAVVIGYFATRPAYTHHDPEKALIKISFSHAGAHIEPRIRIPIHFRGRCGVANPCLDALALGRQLLTQFGILLVLGYRDAERDQPDPERGNARA